MRIQKTKFKNLLIFKSRNFFDNRGFFREIAIKKLIKEKFVFDVSSKSKRNVLRGLHMQMKFQQGKYISVLKGKILDVVVDCRKNSKTFGKNFKIILSDKNCKSLYIPPGFLHGFLGLDNEININTKKPEFINWKWIEPETLPEVIVSFKKDLYSNLLKEIYSVIN